MDAWSAGAAGIDSQRAEDECPECRSGALRFSRIYIRAALQCAAGLGVYRIQSVEEERGHHGSGWIKEKVGDLLAPGNVGPWKEVCKRLNRKLTGWRAYFGCGSTAKAYQAVDEHVYDGVRHFLRKRHKVSSQGTRQFPSSRVYGELGVARLYKPWSPRS